MAEVAIATYHPDTLGAKGAEVRKVVGADGAGITDVARALEIAEKWHDEMRFCDKHGMAFKPAAFSAVCDLFLKKLEEEGAIHPNKARRDKDYRPIVDKVSEAIFQGP